MQKAVLNVKTLNITQGMNGSYSHKGDLAIDMGHVCENLKAPFTGIVKRVYSNCNAIWLESVDKVKFADGTEDYMTVMTLHDDSVTSLPVGTKVTQGKNYYQPGVKGKVTGPHIHMAVGKGKFTGNGWFKNSYGNWCINNQYDITKALFLHTDVKIQSSMYNWVKTDTYEVPQPKPTKSVEEVANEVIAGKWGNNPERKERLEAAGYNYNEVQALVNEKMAKANEPKKEVFKVGDKVKPTKLVDYNGTSLKQYDDYYIISQISGDRAVLTARGQVWAAMNTKNIERA